MKIKPAPLASFSAGSVVALVHRGISGQYVSDTIVRIDGRISGDFIFAWKRFRQGLVKLHNSNVAIVYDGAGENF